MKKHLLFFLLLLINTIALSQGDNCYDAIVISTPGSFCYTQDYSNKTSTQMVNNSGTVAPESCWSTGNNYDMWFTFTAVGTKLTVTVDGMKSSGFSYIYGVGIALLDGTCSGNSSSYSTSFAPAGCVQGSAYSSSATLTANNLTKGKTYFIRISSAKGDRGDFGLCVINSDPAPSGSDDCTGAVKLCDEKSTPSVSSITSKGTKEETSTLKLNNVGMTEHQTIWYQFIAGNAGTLTFNIKPKTDANDIDFGLYQSSTANACGTLTPLRINVSSCWVGDGSTGLKTTSTDQTEAAGCSTGQDEFCQSVTLVPGTTYVLVIDNATPSASDGFDLSFGGTAIFAPDSSFTISPNDFNICTGDAVSFTPTSISNNFTYSWVFDNTGSSQTVTGSATQSRPFNTKGVYTETLTVTNSFNCSNTLSKKIYVNDKPQITLIPTTASLCSGNSVNLSGNITTTGTIASGATTANNNIKTISWSPTGGLSNIGNNGIGSQSGTATASTNTANTYTLSVTDDAGCTNTATSTISSTAPTAPTCPGITVCTGQSGTLTATGSSGSTFKWYADNTTSTTIAGSGTTGSFTTPNLNSLTSYYVSQVSGGCESPRTKVDVNVTNSNSITLTSATGSDAQTVCLNTAISNITYSTTGATGATFTGLPTGVTGAWNSGTITISGTPSVNAGSPYTYTITLTGGCGTVTKTGTITINSSNTITLTSAAGTDNQTKCINTALTNITYSTTSATGATFSGLPSGVTGNWSSNTITISGTPTTNSGSPFNYTITLTGGCGNVTKTGTITVNPNQTLGVTCGTTTSSSVQFTWTNIPSATYNYSYLINNTGSATTGTLTTGTTNFTKSGLNPGDNVSITITPVGGTCVNPETFTCTAVNCGTPTVDPISSITECSNSSVTAINFTSPQGAVTFNWTNNNTSIGLAASGSGNIPTFTSGTVLSQQTATISVTATQGGCTGPVRTFSIIINPLNTITLSSPSGTNAQTVCSNTAINSISYNTTGATGATFSGLPTGVTGNWINNVITISGTPTVANNSPYTYTITLTGGCGTVTATGTIKVNFDNTITLSSAIGTDGQTVCVNSNITNITYNTTGATGATFSGLPTGINGNWNNNTITISGSTSTNIGSPFSYTINLLGGCGTINNSGTITVNPINTITLTSVSNTTNQSVCLNSAITNINYSTTGATGATFSGLPTGVTGNWSNNNITITGTPSSNNGTPFNYTINLTGGCGSISSNGEISIITVNTISLTSALGSDNQSICENSSINTINYSTTGATGATFTGLPNGVSANWNNNQITILGTPSSSIGSPFNYTITLTGGCGNVTKSGTITIAPINSISLTSASGTDNQTICVNSTLTQITYSTTGATGATITGLPTGITGSWNNNSITITGIPTLNSTNQYNYTIDLTGGCGVINSSGSIIVNALNTITLTSGVGTDNQKLCKNNHLTDISYSTTGATGATITGLPTGITGLWNNNQVTIVGNLYATSGNPFQYTITLTGGCGTITKTGNIDLNPDNSISLSSSTGTDNQTICLGAAINSINYVTSSATGANIYGLPNGVIGNWNNNTISISGSPVGSAQNYSYTIHLIGGCPIPDITGNITVNNLPNATPSANTPCEQETLSLNAGVSSMKSYNWTGPNGFTSNQENPSISNVTLNALGQYELIVTDQNNCSNNFALSAFINQIDNIQFLDINSTCKNGSIFSLPAANIPGGTWTSDDNTSIQNPLTGIFDPSKSVPDQDYKVVVTYSTKTITPARLCPSTKSKVVYVYPTPDTNFVVKDNFLCITDTLFAEVLNKNPNAVYTWDFNNGQTLNDTSIFYIYPKSGVFDLTLISKVGMCTNKTTRKGYVTVIDLPSNVDFSQSANVIDFYNPEIQFKTNTNAKYYYWDFGDGYTSTYKNPKHIFPDTPGEYQVTLTVSNLLDKCGISIIRSIFMPEPVIYYIPNTFTPNGDEINNTFQPIFTFGFDPQSFNFYIYNRWGGLIFESHDPKIGWDGTFGDMLVQNDTYVWKLEFKEKIQEFKHVKTGYVNVLR